MTEQQFWAILETARRQSEPRSDFHSTDWFNALKEELARLPPDEILLFRKYFD
jgi:hypothetical protein